MEHNSGEINPERLRELYRRPSQVVKDKAISHIDDGVADFIAHSPLFVLATTSSTGTDSSPRGGPPGFVRVLDQNRIAFGDLTGNNRLDSFQNLLEHPTVGMLFIIPGLEETLRVNGTAALLTDPDVLEQCALDGRQPKVAVCVTVLECYVHCGAAFRRGAIWDPNSWPSAEERPSPAAMIKNHAQLKEAPEQIEAGLTEYYDNGVWETGGQ